MWSWIKGLYRQHYGLRHKRHVPGDLAREEEAHWRRLTAEWPFPLRLVSGSEATTAWYEEAEIGSREGFSPILITPQTWQIPADSVDLAAADIAPPDTIVDTYVRQLIYDFSDGRDALPPFDEASPQQVAAALAKSEEYTQGGAYAFEKEFFKDIEERPTGVPEPESDAQPFGNVRSFFHDGPHPQVAITRLPTPESWRAPLLLGFGGWNACPEPAVMAAFARRWKELYGADIASVTHDTLEFVVERPPATFEEATQLAKEQFIVGNEFNDMDMSDYIASLRTMRRWFFWWD